MLAGQLIGYAVGLLIAFFLSRAIARAWAEATTWPVWAGGAVSAGASIAVILTAGWIGSTLTM